MPFLSLARYPSRAGQSASAVLLAFTFLGVAACVPAPVVTAGPAPGVARFEMTAWSGPQSAPGTAPTPTPTVGQGGMPPASTPDAAASPVVPLPRPIGGGGTGGGSPSGAVTPPLPGPAVDVAGLVRASLPEGEGGPVAGALVRAYGGPQTLEATTDASGRFQLSGFFPGSSVVVTAPGHVPSLVVGWQGTPEALHLATGSPLANHFESYLAVTGTVHDEDGAPAAGAIVLGGNQRGTVFGPLLTDENGVFQGLATSYEGTQVDDLAVFALQIGQSTPATSLGLLEAATLGPDAPPLDIEVQQPVETISFSARGPEGRRAVARIDAQAANGLSVAVASWDPDKDLGNAPYFEVPGMQLTARIEMESADLGARSVCRQAVTAPGFVQAHLLDFPAALAVSRASLSEGRTLSWPASTGAQGYRIAMLRDGQGKPLWEAFTPSPQLTLRQVPGEPVDSLEITAMAEEGSSLFHLAATGPPRRLRWFDSLSVLRYTTRSVQVRP